MAAKKASTTTESLDLTCFKEKVAETFKVKITDLLDIAIDNDDVSAEDIISDADQWTNSELAVALELANELGLDVEVENEKGYTLTVKSR